MDLLKRLRPLLHGASEVTITVSAEGDHLRAVVTTKLAGFDSETTDEGLATLQAALSRPFRLLVAPDSDPDAVLESALATLAADRLPAVDELTAYRETLAASRQKAKDQPKKPAAKAKDKPTGKGAPKKPAPEKKPKAAKADKVGKVPTPAPAKEPGLFDQLSESAQSSPATTEAVTP